MSFPATDPPDEETVPPHQVCSINVFHGKERPGSWYPGPSRFTIGKGDYRFFDPFAGTAFALAGAAASDH